VPAEVIAVRACHSSSIFGYELKATRVAASNVENVPVEFNAYFASSSKATFALDLQWNRIQRSNVW
jgi:hypothetical protein